MSIEIAELDEMQKEYIKAVDEWVAAIHTEEELASVIHNEAELDKWEEADFEEEEARKKAKIAKKNYESALREKFFNF